MSLFYKLYVYRCAQERWGNMWIKQFLGYTRVTQLDCCLYPPSHKTKSHESHVIHTWGYLRYNMVYKYVSMPMVLKYTYPHIWMYVSNTKRISTARGNLHKRQLPENHLMPGWVKPNPRYDSKWEYILLQLSLIWVLTVNGESVPLTLFGRLLSYEEWIWVYAGQAWHSGVDLNVR